METSVNVTNASCHARKYICICPCLKRSMKAYGTLVESAFFYASDDINWHELDRGTYSRGVFCLCRTVEKRSVPFPFYGQPFQSENGYEYDKSTVAKRKRNGTKRTSVCQSEGGGSQFMTRKRPVQDNGDQR